MERTIFGDASGDCLAPVVKVPAGEKKSVNVGSLSCWEHIQPLLKYYTFSQGEQIHVAAWPVLDACPDESPGLFSMSADGCRTLSQAYAMESQSFVLHCVTVLTEKGCELMGTKGSPIMGSNSIGTSCAIGPDGRLLTPKDNKNEELIVVDLDLGQVVKNKTFADAGGHCEYSMLTTLESADEVQIRDLTYSGLAPTRLSSLLSDLPLLDAGRDAQSLCLPVDRVVCLCPERESTSLPILTICERSTSSSLDIPTKLFAHTI